MTDKQIDQLADVLIGTHSNAYMVVDRLFPGRAVDVTTFERLLTKPPRGGIFLCSRCAIWRCKDLRCPHRDMCRPCAVELMDDLAGVEEED